MSAGDEKVVPLIRPTKAWLDEAYGDETPPGEWGEQMERLSAVPALLMTVTLALLAAGIASVIQWARHAPPERTVIVRGVDGPGMRVLHDRMECRVWGRLEVCASHDVRWER